MIIHRVSCLNVYRIYPRYKSKTKQSTTVQFFTRLFIFFYFLLSLLLIFCFSFNSCTNMGTSDASGYLNYVREYFGNSTCSEEATLRGPHQHVVSISLPAAAGEGDLASLNLTVSEIVVRDCVLRI